MCQIDYNKGKKKYQHLTYVEKTMIERWFNRNKKTKVEIAGLLGKSVRTIQREIKRGLVDNIGSYLIPIKVYSADVSHQHYKYNMSSKGPPLILDYQPVLVEHIQTQIKQFKCSPEVIVSQLSNYDFAVKICAKTIRNAIKLGNVFEITNKHLTYNKKYRSKNPKKRVSNKTPSEKSIEFRPIKANDRSEYGHWEGDLVIGKRSKSAALLTLSERKTREEIIIKVSSKSGSDVLSGFDKLERLHKTQFPDKFKSITFDNGPEFNDYLAIEKSVYNNIPRTQVFYAHPYCSGERGTNENGNRLIRRWIPKGTDITTIKPIFIKQVQDWINDYPRAMFDYKSSNMLLSEMT